MLEAGGGDHFLFGIAAEGIAVERQSLLRLIA